MHTELVTVERASALTGQPVFWLAGLIESGQLVAQRDEQGRWCLAVDDLRRHWAFPEAVPSLAHLNRLLDRTKNR